MTIEFDYLRDLLFQIESNDGFLVIPNTLDRDITKERCAQSLLDKGYLYTVNEQCYCLTEPGYDFIDVIRDEAAWATITNELAASGRNKIRDLITLVENKMKTLGDFSRASMTTGKKLDISPHNHDGQKENPQYEVALSFAGEQRDYVGRCCKSLTKPGDRRILRRVREYPTLGETSRGRITRRI